MERLGPEVRRQLEGIVPTPRQLAYLRALAKQRGTTFAQPLTRQQAHAQIERLKRGRRRQPGLLEPVTRGRTGLAPDSWRPFS